VTIVAYRCKECFRGSCRAGVDGGLVTGLIVLDGPLSAREYLTVTRMPSKRPCLAVRPFPGSRSPPRFRTFQVCPRTCRLLRGRLSVRHTDRTGRTTVASTHEAARVHHADRGCGSRLASRSARAADRARPAHRRAHGLGGDGSIHAGLCARAARQASAIGMDRQSQNSIHISLRRWRPWCCAGFCQRTRRDAA
jgi:hypothetical protein